MWSSAARALAVSPDVVVIAAELRLALGLGEAGDADAAARYGVRV